MSDWHPEDVKAAIRKTGETAAGLAVAHGYEKSAVRWALYKRWPKVEAVIARHLQVNPWDIWPSRYDAEHQPIRRKRGRRAQTSTPAN